MVSCLDTRVEAIPACRSSILTVNLGISTRRHRLLRPHEGIVRPMRHAMVFVSLVRGQDEAGFLQFSRLRVSSLPVQLECSASFVLQCTSLRG
jgi:hypothetical protein